MNQERIGKFIAECRRQKKFTQSEVAEKLGVTDRSVSNWENGKNMPDLSLLKPLCEILDISINELLSGERLGEEEYQERFEENIVNTIDYSTKRMTRYKSVISLLFLLFGLFISLSAIMIFPSESSWGSIYSIIGILVFMIGISRITHFLKWYWRLGVMIFIFVFTMSVLLFADYVNVKLHQVAPMFRMTTKTTGDVIYYDTLFYDVYRCYFDEENEYWVVTENGQPSVNDLIDYCH